MCLPALASAQDTILDVDFGDATCSDPGWTRSSNEPLCGWYLNVIDTLPGDVCVTSPPTNGAQAGCWPSSVGTGVPGGCAAVVDAFGCGGDSSADLLELPTLDLTGYVSATLTFDTYIRISSAVATNRQDLWIDVVSSAATESFQVPEANGWVTRDIDLSAHANASAVDITFRSTDDGAIGLGVGIDNVLVTGSRATGSVSINSPADGAVFNRYPVDISVITTPNALQSLLDNRVELWGIGLGALTPASSTQGTFEVTRRLVQGNNLIRTCLSDAGVDIDCDEVTIGWEPATGDVNADLIVNAVDVTALVSRIISADPVLGVADMNGNGVNEVLDVVQILNIILSCDSPYSNVARGALARMDNETCDPGGIARAIDGNYSGTLANVATTCNLNAGHYMEFDLGAQYEFGGGGIVLYNRTDGFPQRLSDIVVTIFNGGTIAYQSAPQSYNPAAPASLIFPVPPVVGNRVRITKQGATGGFQFHLAEIEINGRLNESQCVITPQYVVSYEFEEEDPGAVTSTAAGGIPDLGSIGLPATANAAINYVLGDPSSFGDTSALDFTGTQRLTLSSANRGDYGDIAAHESFTVEALVNLDANASADEIMTTQGVATDVGFTASINAGGFMELRFVDNQNQVATVTGSTIVTPGAWHTLHFVRNAAENELWLFLDGILEATAVDATLAASNSSGALMVGDGAQGAFDFVRFSNFVVDPRLEPIALPYYDPFTVDRGWSGYDGSGVDFNVESWGGAGTDEVFALDTSSVTEADIAFGDILWDDYFVTVWAYPLSATGSVTVYGRVVDDANHYRAVLDYATGELSLYARVNGIDQEIASSSVSVTVGDWVNLGLVMNGNLIDGYVNGDLTTSAVDSRIGAGRVGLGFAGQTGGAANVYGARPAFDGLQITAPDGLGIPYVDPLQTERAWVVFDDFYTSGGPSQWDVSGGQITQLTDVDGGYGNYGSLFAGGDTTWTNYRVRANIRTTDNDYAGVAGRVQNAETYYRLLISESQTPRVRLDLFHPSITAVVCPDGCNTCGSGFCELDVNNSVAISGGTNHSVELELNGTRLNGYVDGVEVVSVINDTIVYGGFGLISRGNTGGIYSSLSAVATACGDGTCDAGDSEDNVNCPADCAICGDGICAEPFENRAGCVEDCHFCGDGFCDNATTLSPESFANCPVDCCNTDADCDDTNVCTNDSCDQGVCINAPNTNSCDDLNDCTYDDVCSGGTCGGTTVTADDGPDADNVGCDDDPGICGANRSCNGTATCDVTYPGGETSCNDGLFCNGTDTCDGAGLCAHTGDPCAGGAFCSNFCNEAADNCFRANGATDGNAVDCPGGATAATCIQDSVFCNGVEECDGSGNIVSPGNPCPQTDPQCSDACVTNSAYAEANDTCAIANAVACNDGLFCTQTDLCNGSGACIGTGNPCAAGDQCNNQCNEPTDNCFVTAATPCNDGDSCTAGDQCNGLGTCTPTQILTCATNPNSLARSEPFCSDITDTFGTSCIAPYGITPVLQDNSGSTYGVSRVVNANCEDLGSTGHWYRVTMNDILTQDQAANGDNWGPHIAFVRNDGELFEARIYANSNTATTWCSSASSQHCQGFMATSSGTWPDPALGRNSDALCTIIDEYTQTLSYGGESCYDLVGQDGSLAAGHCIDNTTHYWVHVTLRDGAVCDACQAYALRFANGNQCFSDVDCPGTFLCDTSPHPNRCFRIDDPNNPLNLGNVGDGSAIAPLQNGDIQTVQGTCDDMPEGHYDYYQFTALDENLSHIDDPFLVELGFLENSDGNFRFEVLCPTDPWTDHECAGGATTFENPGEEYIEYTVNAGQSPCRQIITCTTNGDCPGSSVCDTGTNRCAGSAADLGSGAHCANDTTTFKVRVFHDGPCNGAQTYRLQIRNGYPQSFGL